RTGDTWAETARRHAPNGTGGDHFGAAVALGGGRALVGADLDDVPFGDWGSAHLLTQSGTGQWTFRAQLGASDAADSDQLGNAVAIDGDHILVGASLDNAPSNDSGSAYTFSVSTCLAEPAPPCLAD